MGRINQRTVVAAAVVFPPGTEIEGIDDSKALDENEMWKKLDTIVETAEQIWD